MSGLYAESEKRDRLYRLVTEREQLLRQRAEIEACLRVVQAEIKDLENDCE